LVVAEHAQRVDVGACRGTVAGDRDHLVGEAMQGMSRRGMHLLHELGDGVHAAPCADLDPGGIAHQ
jgi:hypothetical protein